MSFTTPGKLLTYVLLLLCLAILGCGQAPQTADEPQPPGPKDEALTSALTAHNIYGMAIYSDDKLIAEYYKDGYNESSLFPLYSCTKSITSILIGMAIDQGAIKSPDQFVAELLPNRGITSGTAGKGQLRLHHLLNQTSGFYWPEWTNPHIVGELSSFRRMP
jgi:CubicO group peptidase (beta-lactamase class C family)